MMDGTKWTDWVVMWLVVLCISAMLAAGIWWAVWSFA